MAFKKLTYKLYPPELETRFRQESLERDFTIAAILLVIAIIFQMISFPTDYLLMAGSDRLYPAWGVRGISAVLAGGTLLLLRRNLTVALFDKVVFAWASLLIIGIVTVNAMLPPDYTLHVAWDLLLALAAYAILPLALNRQIIVALIISAGDLVLFSQYKTLANPGAFIDISTAFVCVNILGIFTSWEIHRWRRVQFTAFQREAATRRRLERALLDIKTLEGIIPICSFCKNIRNDKGYWENVDQYLAEHTDARFSHSLCPDCLKKEYPEEYKMMLKDKTL